MTLSAELRDIQKKIGQWNEQRWALKRNLEAHIVRAQEMINGLINPTAAAKAARFDEGGQDDVRLRPGRKRGHVHTATARRRMRAAWKRRKAAAKGDA